MINFLRFFEFVTNSFRLLSDFRHREQCVKEDFSIPLSTQIETKKGRKEVKNLETKSLSDTENELFPPFHSIPSVRLIWAKKANPRIEDDGKKREGAIFVE